MAAGLPEEAIQNLVKVVRRDGWIRPSRFNRVAAYLMGIEKFDCDLPGYVIGLARYGECGVVQATLTILEERQDHTLLNEYRPNHLFPVHVGGLGAGERKEGCRTGLKT